MEYLDGEDLETLLRRRRSLPIDQAVELAVQACEVLSEAHALGIVHRDSKPANLFCVSSPRRLGGRAVVGQGARLRHLQGDGGKPDDGARHHGLAGLHVTGANSFGAHRRWAGRHLGDGRRTFRDAHGARSLQRAKPPRHVDRHRHRAHALRSTLPPRRSEATRSGHPEVPAKRPRGPTRARPSWRRLAPFLRQETSAPPPSSRSACPSRSRPRDWNAFRTRASVWAGSVPRPPCSSRSWASSEPTVPRPRWPRPSRPQMGPTSSTPPTRPRASPPPPRSPRRPHLRSRVPARPRRPYSLARHVPRYRRAVTTPATGGGS